MLKTKQLENLEYVLIIDGIAKFGLEPHESLKYLRRLHCACTYWLQVTGLDSVLSEKNS